MKKITSFLKQPEIIFAFVAIYAITAFGWWTIAHIQAADELYVSKRTGLDLLTFQATLDIKEGIKHGIFKDSLSIREHLSVLYPRVQVQFIHDTLENKIPGFYITPSTDALSDLESKNARTKWMYGLEGLVMLLLLIWGIVWIYQSLNRILGLNKRQNNFMLAITHELKTPIASAKLYQETLLKRHLDANQQHLIIRNTLAEINRLRDLVDNILLASQLETTTFEIQPAELNFSKLINQCVENFAVPRNLLPRFVLNVEENVFITTDEQAMEAIITNLISNAAKYSPSDMPIAVDLMQDSTTTILRISDKGSGISDKDKKRIFDKFYRIGDETTRKTKGTGLGLFIVKNLVNRIGGELLVKDNVPNGTIFELSLKQ